jgi:hypothetical protein
VIILVQQGHLLFTEAETPGSLPGTICAASYHVQKGWVDKIIVKHFKHYKSEIRKYWKCELFNCCTILNQALGMCMMVSWKPKLKQSVLCQIQLCSSDEISGSWSCFVNSTWMNLTQIFGLSLVMSYRRRRMLYYGNISMSSMLQSTQICFLSGSLVLTIVLASDANAAGDAADDSPSEVPMEVGEMPMEVGEVPMEVGEVPMEVGEVPWRLAKCPWRLAKCPWRLAKCPWRLAKIYCLNIYRRN